MRTHRSTPGRAFVLLEVIISLTIMTATIAAILRSFSQSMGATRQMEVKTKAAIFAQQLMDEFETRPPEEGETVGGFGDLYFEYSYKVTMTYEEPEYDDLNRNKNVEKFIPMRNLKIEINYDNGRNQPFKAIEIQTAIIGFERFTREARLQFLEY